MKFNDFVRNADKVQESISFPADMRKRQGINQSLLNALLCTIKNSLENLECQGAINEKMEKIFLDIAWQKCRAFDFRVFVLNLAVEI